LPDSARITTLETMRVAETTLVFGVLRPHTSDLLFR
jgi:hypothetical protein